MACNCTSLQLGGHATYQVWSRYTKRSLLPSSREISRSRACHTHTRRRLVRCTLLLLFPSPQLMHLLLWATFSTITCKGMFPLTATQRYTNTPNPTLGPPTASPPKWCSTRNSRSNKPPNLPICVVGAVGRTVPGGNWEGGVPVKTSDQVPRCNMTNMTRNMTVSKVHSCSLTCCATRVSAK